MSSVGEVQQVKSLLKDEDLDFHKTFKYIKTRGKLPIVEIAFDITEDGEIDLKVGVTSKFTEAEKRLICHVLCEALLSEYGDITNPEIH